MRYAGLLRGINVGGKNKMPMRDLAALFAASGCAEVETHIQSGNVVFAASGAVVKSLPEVISQGIADRYGYSVPVIVRSAEQLGRIVEDNPFLMKGAVEKELHVYFLAESPSAVAAAELDPNRSPPDEFALRGAEVYLRLPNGMGRTKLTNAYFDARLSTICTARNWATVLKLRALTNR